MLGEMQERGERWEKGDNVLGAMLERDKMGDPDMPYSDVFTKSFQRNRQTDRHKQSQ